MTLLLAICASVIIAVSIYLILGRELKGIAMGMFLLSHAAHLGILAMSGAPLVAAENGAVVTKGPPVLGMGEVPADPVPQALILTSIVISFAVTAFMLTLIVITHRRTGSLEIAELMGEDRPAPPTTF
jgi:multicomponent Na+:H+ antiporter subunit C